MSNIDADVWILTETHEQLSPGSGFEAHSSGPPDRDHEPGERWVTIWSRLPMEALSEMSDSSRTAAARILSPRLGAVVVFGTVLPWLGSAWRDVPAGNGAAFRAALALQVADWGRIQQAHPDAAWVVAGDLNQDLAGRHYYGSRVNRALLEEALSSSGLRCLTGGELDPVPQHAPSHASIDHICVSSKLAAVGPARSWPHSASPPRDLSDHFGLVVDVDRINCDGAPT